MVIKRDGRIDGEFDFPLPKRKLNPSKEDIEKLEKLLAKYGRFINTELGLEEIASERHSNSECKIKPKENG